MTGAPMPRHPLPWRATVAAPGPLRAQAAAELTDLLTRPEIDHQRVCRVFVTSTYALSGEELSYLMTEAVRLLQTGVRCDDD